MTNGFFKNLRSVIDDVASRKHRAAVARTEVQRHEVEPPREVYLAACEQIAASFAVRGFRYAKTAQRFTLSGAPFSFSVSFQSSHHNVAGEHVALSLAGRVTSRVLKAWRTRQELCFRNDDWVAGGMAHLLGTDFAYVEWDLADPVTRPQTVAEIIRFVDEVVMAYFELFTDPAGVIERLAYSAIPEFQLGSAVEFALCFGTRADAQAILDRFALERPDLVSAASRSVLRFQRDGTPKHAVNAYAEQVAVVVVAYGLSWPAA